MYVLTVEDGFSSAHQLLGYKGKCENLHGHNWRVVLSVRGSTLDERGLLLDFNDLKSILKRITGELDHKNLNELDSFRTSNPSSENIARYIAERVRDELAGHGGSDVVLESVTVWESETARCTFTP
jgi:6-pyruvoyltetrahydropterin/6-carboxytetrahydropterin synthase